MESSEKKVCFNKGTDINSRRPPSNKKYATIAIKEQFSTLPKPDRQLQESSSKNDAAN